MKKTTSNNNFSTNVAFPIGSKLYGKAVKEIAFNQLITNDKVFLETQTSVVPSGNMCGSFIMILNPMVGHKVHAKITTSNSKLRLCWYKTNNTAYDFATGQALDTSSQPLNTFESVYEITQDMVHSGTGYLQLYYWIYAGMPTEQHTITVQLTDLTALGWHNMNLEQFKAIYPNETYNYQARVELSVVGLEKTALNTQELSLPLYAIPNENTKICLNQLVDTGTTSIALISGRKYFVYKDGLKLIMSGGETLQVVGGKDMVMDLTLMYGSGNEPETLEELPNFVKNKYHDYNTGSFDYAEWKVRDVWENCKQTKNIRVADLGSLNWSYDSDLQAFYTNGLFSLIKAPTSANDPLNAILGKYDVVAYNEMANKTLCCTDTGFVYIKDTDYNDPTAFKESLDGKILYYESASAVETITSTLLVAQNGNNTLTQYDNNDNEIDCEFELEYNYLTMKVGNKYVKYINDRKIKAITRGKLLPNGYKRLDYIESTGTQYIDTGIVRDIDNNTYKLKLNVSYSNVNTRQLQGVQGYVYVGVVNGYWQYGSASNDHTNIQAIPNIFHSIELNANKTKSSFIYGKINNIDVVGGSQISNSPVNAHFCLFMLNGFNFPSSCKNKECELYENDILVRNFIPCINDQNEVGMYDTVSQTFFGNRGTGVFIAGNIIEDGEVLYEKPTLPSGFEELESIESTGTQYIDTNVLSGEINKAKIVWETTQIQGGEHFIFGGFKTGYSQSLRTGYYNNGVLYDNYSNMINIPKTTFGVNVIVNSSIIQGGLWSSDFNLYLFAQYRKEQDDANAYIKAKLHKCELSNNDTIVRNLLPCKRTHDNNVAMIDLVSGKWFGNAGTGSFVAHTFDE